MTDFNIFFKPVSREEVCYIKYQRVKGTYYLNQEETYVLTLLHNKWKIRITFCRLGSLLSRAY